MQVSNTIGANFKGTITIPKRRFSNIEQAIGAVPELGKISFNSESLGSLHFTTGPGNKGSAERVKEAEQKAMQALDSKLIKYNYMA